MPVMPYGGHAPRVGDGCFVAPTAYLVGDVVLGDACSLWFGVTLRADTGSIRAGDGVNFQEASTVHTQDDDVTSIGSGVSIGHHALVHSAVIEDEVLVGVGASVLSGARVGRGSLIAAHAVVTEGTTIPPRSLVVGIPGRVVRETSEAEFERISRTCATYRSLCRDYLESVTG